MEPHAAARSRFCACFLPYQHHQRTSRVRPTIIHIPGSSCHYNGGITMLPQISPSPLMSLKEPIGHPNWVHELKHDGFRGMLYVDREQAWLVSRNWNKFR